MSITKKEATMNRLPKPAVAGSNMLLVLCLLALFLPWTAVHANDRLAILDADGQLARLAADELLAAGLPAERLVLVTQRPSALASYGERGVEVRGADMMDPATLIEALAGTHRLLLVTARPLPWRIDMHRNVIDAAVESGVQHLVYTSSVDADNRQTPLALEHRQTERYLEDSGLDWTVLRLQLFSDGLVLNVAAAMLNRGEALIPENDVAVAYISQRDTGAALAIVLRDADRHRNRRYEITGAERFTLRDIADIAMELTAIEIPIVIGGSGLEGSYGPALDYGAYDIQSDSLSRLLGREPDTLRERLERAAAVLHNAAYLDGLPGRREY